MLYYSVIISVYFVCRSPKANIMKILLLSMLVISYLDLILASPTRLTDYVDIITKGVTDANFIAENLLFKEETSSISDDHFSFSMNNVERAIPAMFKGIQTVMRSIDEVAQTAELVSARKDFADANGRLKVLASKVRDFKQTIEGLGNTNGDLSESESNILTVADQLQLMISSDNPTQHRDRLVTLCNGLSGGVYKVYDIITSSDLDSYHIFFEAMDYSMYDRRFVQNVTKAVLALAILGYENEIACQWILTDNTATINTNINTNTSANGNIHISLLAQLENDMMVLARSVDVRIDQLVRRNWYNYYSQVIDTFLAGFAEGSQQELSFQLFELMTRKYFWRDWVVIVYKSVPQYSEYESHFVSLSSMANCYGVTHFAGNSYNVMVATMENQGRVISVKNGRVEDCSWERSWAKAAILEQRNACLRVALDINWDVAFQSTHTSQVDQDQVNVYCNHTENWYNVFLFGHLSDSSSDDQGFDFSNLGWGVLGVIVLLVIGYTWWKHPESLQPRPQG